MHDIRDARAAFCIGSSCAKKLRRQHAEEKGNVQMPKTLQVRLLSAVRCTGNKGALSQYGARAFTAPPLDRLRRCQLDDCHVERRIGHLAILTHAAQMIATTALMPSTCTRHTSTRALIKPAVVRGRRRQLIAVLRQKQCMGHTRAFRADECTISVRHLRPGETGGNSLGELTCHPLHHLHFVHLEATEERAHLSQ